MNVLKLDDDIDISKTVIALGNFDGVHAGHAKLLEIAVKRAEEKGAVPAVWSFDGYSPKTRGNCIILPSERPGIFKNFGIKVLFTCRFEEIRDMPAHSFITDMLIKKCGCIHTVCGYNYRFGKGAQGSAKMLQSILSDNGYGADIVDMVTVNGIPVSSTLIRNHLSDGDVFAAAKLLGRYFSLDLPVVHGAHLGTGLGFPTFNQNYPENIVRLKAGVYVTRASFDGQSYTAVTNVGIKPTVGGNAFCCETHIPDYSGDLYGKTVKIEFLDYIRAEKKFGTIEELCAQIKTDIEKVRNLK